MPYMIKLYIVFLGDGKHQFIVNMFGEDEQVISHTVFTENEQYKKLIRILRKRYRQSQSSPLSNSVWFKYIRK